MFDWKTLVGCAKIFADASVSDDRISPSEGDGAGLEESGSCDVSDEKHGSLVSRSLDRFMFRSFMRSSEPPEERLSPLIVSGPGSLGLAAEDCSFFLEFGRSCQRLISWLISQRLTLCGKVVGACTLTPCDVTFAGSILPTKLDNILNICN